MSLEKLIKQLAAQGMMSPGIVTQNPWGLPPITVPTIKPLFPGVNDCSSNLANKDSCDMCDLSAVIGSFGQITNQEVRTKMNNAAFAINSICALLGGCSQKADGNKAPWGAGTACVCTAIMKLISDFKATVAAAILQQQWNSSAIKDANSRLVKQKKACISSIQACFRSFSVSENSTAEKEIIKMLNRYAV
jgi:hypothetical protein